jgi:hypothetical protein
MWEKNGVYDSDVNIIAVSGIYNVSDCVYFVFEGQVTESATVTISQVVTGRNVCVV